MTRFYHQCLMCYESKSKAIYRPIYVLRCKDDKKYIGIRQNTFNINNDIEPGN